MQRAAATSPASSPASATRTAATEPSSKRRRIEGTTTTSSPSISAPGTPRTETPNGQRTPSLLRGGSSTFIRVEGTDTDWVLDVPVQISNPSPAQTSSTIPHTNGNHSSTSRFGVLANREENREDAFSEEDNIWAPNLPRGRQTFGSFKRKSRTTTTSQQPINNDNDADLTPNSDSEAVSSDSEEDPDSRLRRKPEQTGPRNSSNPNKGQVDSDEEMRQVRHAMGKKLNNMQFKYGQGGGGGGGRRDHDRGQRGTKRRGGRDEGNYKMKKKARKTI